MDPLEISFVRTWRLLTLARFRSRAGIIVALVAFFGAWLVWLVFGRVSIYASSQEARLEAERFPQPIQSPTDGIVVECNLSLGQRVREGEVLVRLDTRAFELQRAEAQATLDADLGAITSLQAELDAQQKARAAAESLLHDTARAGRAKVAVSQTTERFRAQETDVLRKLNEKDLTSKLDTIRAEGDNATIHAQVAATSAQANQETSSYRATLLDRDVQIAALSKLLVDAQSRAQVLRANVDSISYEIDRRRIKTNASGVLADIIPCTPGMTLTPDKRLAMLLPDSEIRVVGLFKSEDAVGRVKPGQSATLRINNFPWTQFGTVGATVDHVGSEPRDGLVRVEMHVSRLNPSIPIQNGLTAVAEAQVEKISPLHLLLRTIGEQIRPAAPGT